MDTLEEAIATGQGVERPFRCTEHPDAQASASVNVLKGVWYCHACQASGTVDGKKAPKVADLQAMLEPEVAVRVYPLAYLELFDDPTYWRTRFPDWVCHAMELGHDPFNNAGTFPVHTPSGLLAGVGRRFVTDDKHARYMYPRRWSAANTLFGTNGRYPSLPVLTLVEGAGDATACWEVGAPALGVYGSGVHLPQRDLIVRYNPKLILLGFDTDDAGNKAVSAAFKMLGRIAPMSRVYWPKNDPADCTPAQRRKALLSAVGRSNYGVNVTEAWEHNVETMTRAHQRFVEERAA
jgi:DNA primase